MGIDSSRWFASPSPDAGGTRLICLPYAGGGTAIFRDWPAALPGIAVCPARLPGREARFVDPAFTRIEPLVDALADALAPWTDRAYALFGHSMGAIVAFELARRMRDRGLPAPRRLFAAGRQAPHIPEPEPMCHELPDAALATELRSRYGSTTAFEHPELVELMLPTLRADCAICETYRHVDGEPLNCPIHVFGGTDDATVSADDLDAWRAHTSGPFTSERIDGDHFFIDTNPAPLLDAIRTALDAA